MPLPVSAWSGSIVAVGKFGAWFWIGGALLLVGCASRSYAPVFGPRPAAETAQRLPFLRDGITTRAECAARLGLAQAEFEEGRIWVYAFTATANGGARQRGSVDGALIGQPSDFTDTAHPYDLVLTFGADGRLTRHTLVEKPGRDAP